MIIFEKFALTEDEIAFLTQQQAEAVERAVLRERCAQLELRLQESQTYGTRAINVAFETLGYAGKLTGADEDRVLPVAQILQGVLEIWQKITGRGEAPVAASGFHVSIPEIALFYAQVQGYPFLADALEAELRKIPVAFTRAADVVAACEDVWDDILDEYEKGDGEVVGSSNLSAFAQGYANKQGRADLSDAFAAELMVASALADHSLEDFVEHSDRVLEAWERVLAAATSETPSEEEEA